MIMDQTLVLWDNVALTTSAYSTNSYDCGAIPTGGSANGDQPDPSGGIPLGMLIAVTVAATHAGSETYEFDITQSASTTASSSPDTLVQVAFTFAQSSVLLTAGSAFLVPLPPGSVTKRYLSGHYVSANSATISVIGWLGPISSLWNVDYYTSAIVIS